MKQEVIKLYDSGLTMQQVGDIFGVSRQRIQQILKAHGVAGRVNPMLYVDHCQRCKTLEGPFIKVSERGKMCRPCNTERSKVYRHTANGRKRFNRAMARSMLKNADKQKARGLVNYNLRVGNITKPDACVCGNPKVEGHHSDYSRPLDVDWLCRQCHADKHRSLKLTTG